MAHMLRSASLTNYVDVARAAGLDPFQQLQSAGIGLQSLLDPDIKIPAAAVACLLETSAAAAGMADFGLRLGETRELANLGALAFVVRKEPTLRRALRSMAHYLRLQNEALTLRLEEGAGIALIRSDLDSGYGGPQRQADELAVTVTYRLMQLLLGSAWKPRSVNFAHPAPASVAHYARVFGVRVDFGQDFNGIVCLSADLDAALPTYEPGMDDLVHRFLDAKLAQTGVDPADRVRQLVRTLLPSEDCSVERVAQQMGIDRRTVHRRLRAQGQTYSGLVDAIRMEQAPHHLLHGERTLSDVAALLGFASASAFARWFRSRHGCSVTEWRRTLPPE